MTRVLFTGGGGAGNEALYRLCSSRYQMHFADADPASIDPSIPLDRRHALPFASDAGFVETVAALCRRESIDVLVPGVDEELPAMPEVQRLVPELSILVPQPDYVATMLDKLDTMRVLEGHGVAVPQTVTMVEATAMAYPCLVKPRKGRGSRGIHVVDSADQAAAHLVVSGLSASDVILQELLEGQEYTVLMAADFQRHLHAVVPVRVDKKRGITLSGETEDSPVVIEACRAIHRVMPARGCYNIQLMLAPDGRVAPFEINPRVSTTLCLCVAAQIDPIAIFIGQPGHEGVAEGFRPGVRLRRHWSNHFMAPA